MNKKYCIIFAIVFTFCLNIFAGETVLKYTVTVPQKSTPALTSAVMASDINIVCCIYQSGQHYSVDNDGNVKLIGDYTFSVADAGVDISPAKTRTIGGNDYSYQNIKYSFQTDYPQNTETVKGSSAGTQSVKVLQNAMINAIKKSKVYKKNKKKKKSFSGMIYPTNRLSLNIGALNVSVKETFILTDR